MQLFYCPEIIDDIVVLPIEEAHHIFHVLRSKSGENIQLTNGKGSLYTAKILEISKKTVTAEIIDEIKFQPRKNTLHIAIAPTKNIDRLEWFIEKATEIGIEQITPLRCQRSERKEVKQERLEKVIISAAKQSGKAYFPNMNPIISFEKFIILNFNETKLIAHCDEGEKKSLKEIFTHAADALILIGPEGDFVPKEIELAIANGFSSLSLGLSRLRTETAALHVCSSFAIFNGE